MPVVATGSRPGARASCASARPSAATLPGSGPGLRGRQPDQPGLGRYWVRAGVATAPPTDGQCPATHPVKGNHSRSGDFIYHIPGSQFYDRTEAEVCFASAEEAQAAGFRAPR